MGQKIQEREKQLEELAGDQNPEAGPEAFSRGAMEKGRCVRVIEGEEVRRDDPFKYFFPVGVGCIS